MAEESVTKFDLYQAGNLIGKYQINSSQFEAVKNAYTSWGYTVVVTATGVTYPSTWVPTEASKAQVEQKAAEMGIPKEVVEEYYGKKFIEENKPLLIIGGLLLLAWWLRGKR